MLAHDAGRKRGQRFAWFAGEYLVNALEREHKPTQKAALGKNPILQPIRPRQAEKPVRHSRFAEEGGAADVLACYRYDVIGRINKLLKSLPRTAPCYLALDLGDGLPDIALNWLPEIHRTLIRIRGLSGLRILDYWLDCHYQKPSALLVISVHLEGTPKDDAGEAIAVLLMTNCRIQGVPPVSVRLHRPQINHDGDLVHALRHAMLWADLDKQAPLRGWITGGKLASSGTLSCACEAYAPALTVQRYVNIDTVAGFAGVTAPWQALILATRQCLADGEAQMVITESSPTYRQLCAVTPE
ncbi:hypothetical protein [Martelella alba]|uniref:Uncharacterized protein n=1 Tax=Martelella alba TaxID=2590451 RepID=A0ABY2SFY5_9HYPH|nr:hypothetical protein [Martelella alba]TKI03718.1 hypothetical protein FCN80_20570 [Martelella alba]